ncbi:MAG TPA: DUF6228 family protein [Pyrinomonadaceae bacterium]|jgi:hypothetical protein|nr:DUF6228 family protein [Pyrinomonadaceae bacterium]
MSDTLEIKSANGTSALEIALWQTGDDARRFDYLDVTLTAAGLRASTRIYNHDAIYAVDASAIATFFQDVASNWRGWPGEKRWESIEGDLKLTCTSTTLGNVNVAVELHSFADDSFTWDVRCSLVIESWQLDLLAAQAKKVFRI